MGLCQLPGVATGAFGQDNQHCQRQMSQGVPYMVANTQITPNFTHVVEFGVLDLPSLDGLLGVSFLNQFLPYSIKVSLPTDKVVLFTLPKTKEAIQLCGANIDKGTYMAG